MESRQHLIIYMVRVHLLLRLKRKRPPNCGPLSTDSGNGLRATIKHFIDDEIIPKTCRLPGLLATARKGCVLHGDRWSTEMNMTQ